jgi:hypothetical protein
LAVLALPAKQQVAWLDSLGMPGKPALADELALEFDDGYRLVQQFVVRGWIPEGALAGLRQVDALLAEMSSPEQATVWEVAALESSDRWEEIRTRARSALFSL